MCGARSVKAALYMDAALWSLDKLRHGSGYSALSLMIARDKELRRRHAAVREAVDGPI